MAMPFALPASASTETYTRNPAGNKRAIDNATLNQRLEFDYDANNRRIGMSGGRIDTHYERDATGRISELTYGNETTRFNRDELGVSAKESASVNLEVQPPH